MVAAESRRLRSPAKSLYVVTVCVLVIVAAAQVAECQRRNRREPGVFVRTELEPGKDYITLRLRRLSREGAKRELMEEPLWQLEEDLEFVELDEQADGANLRVMLAWLEGLAQRLGETERDQLDLRLTGEKIEKSTRVDVKEFDKFAIWWSELGKTVFGQSEPGARTGLARELSDFLAREQNTALAVRAQRTSDNERQFFAIMSALALHTRGHMKIESYQMLDKYLNAAERLLATTDKHLARYAKAAAQLAEFKRTHHEFNTINKFLEDKISW